MNLTHHLLRKFPQTKTKSKAARKKSHLDDDEDDDEYEDDDDGSNAKKLNRKSRIEKRDKAKMLEEQERLRKEQERANLERLRKEQEEANQEQLRKEQEEQAALTANQPGTNSVDVPETDADHGTT